MLILLLEVSGLVLAGALIGFWAARSIYKSQSNERLNQLKQNMRRVHRRLRETSREGRPDLRRQTESRVR